MRVKAKILEVLDPGIKGFKRLSSREQFIIVGGISLIIPVALYQTMYIPAYDAFVEQSETIKRIQQDFSTVPFVLARYKKLKAKKDHIEEEFKQVEIKEGEQSLLENLLSGKVEAGFDITPMPPQPFGGNYEQANFSVRFTTSSLSNVVDILTEISTGKKRMLLTTMSLSKDSTGEKLRVELGVSSVRQIKQS